MDLCSSMMRLTQSSLTSYLVPPQRSSWPTSSDLLYVVGEESYQLLYINMTLPNSNGIWPEELGGRLYPPELGRLSRLFHEQLISDCPECSPMPDPDNATDCILRYALASTLKPETYLFLPMW